MPIEIGGRQFTFDAPVDEPVAEQPQEEEGPSMARLLQYGWDSTYIPTQHALALYEQLSSPFPSFERAKQKVEKEKYLREKYPDIHGTEYANSASSIASGFFKQLVDPITMPLYFMPLFKTLTGAAVGGASALGIASLRGLAEEGEVDPVAAGTAAALGIVGGGVAGKLGQRAKQAAERDVGELGYAITQRFREYRKQGLHSQESFRRAAADFATDETGATKVVEQAEDYLKKHGIESVRKMNKDVQGADLTPLGTMRSFLEVRPSRQLSEDQAAQLALRSTKDPFAAQYKAPGKFAQTMENYFGVLRDQVSKMSPRIGNLMVRNDFKTLGDIHRYQDKLVAGQKLFQKLPSATQAQVKLALANSDDAAVRSLTSPELYAAIQTIRRDVFSELATLAERSGHKLKLLRDYWPRHYDDWEGFLAQKKLDPLSGRLLQKYGINEKKFSKLQQEVYDAYHKGHLSETEVQEKLRSVLTRPQVQALSTGKTANLLERKIDALDLEDMKFVADPFQSARIYIHDVVENANKRLMLGFTDPRRPHQQQLDLQKSIAGFLDREARAKNIRYEDIPTLRDLLWARYGPGERAPTRMNQRIKNVTYGMTLTDPMVAAVQLGDTGTSMALNGVVNVLRSVLGRRVKMEDVNLRTLYEELASTTRTAKWLDRFLKVSGFNAMDKFGKSVFLTSALRRLKGQVSSERGLARFVGKYRTMFDGDELADVIKDLRTTPFRQSVRNMNPNTKALLFAELADVQPITRSEMPRRYLEHPNGRIFYMLRTFVIRQMNMMLKKTVGEFDRNPAAAMKNAARLGVLLVGTNAGIDTFRRSLKGEEVEFSDAAVGAMLRSFALSQYVVDQGFSMSKESGKVNLDVPRMLGLLLTPPPYSVGSESVESVLSWLSDDPNLKAVRNMPFGKTLYDFLLADEEKK